MPRAGNAGPRRRAERDYGVVVREDGSIDLEASSRRRAAMAQDAAAGVQAAMETGP